MATIDTRTVELGRYFTDVEDRHAVDVCLIGDRLTQEFFAGTEPDRARPSRPSGTEFTVVGTFEKIGSVLGQDQDNFLVIPLRTFLKLRGQRNSLTLHVKAEGGDKIFELAQDDARRVLRARRHVAPGKEDDFFIGTARELHLAVAEHQLGILHRVRHDQLDLGGGGRHRHHERDAGQRHRADQGDRRPARGGRHAIGLLRQFLMESVVQCLAGGAIGVAIGFGCALALRN